MRLFPFSRFIVFDNSMVPSFFPGEHVLTFNWTNPKPNEVIVFEEKNAAYIKRVSKIKADVITCIGDNKRNSKKAYVVSLNNIVGKVILKY